MARVKDVKSKPVKITLRDGVEREIRFTLNAMAELEDKYGSVEAAFKALEKNSIKAVRFVLWAGLMHEDPELTEMQVGNLIDTTYMQELMGSVNTAFNGDMPVPTEVPVQAKVINESVEDPNV